MHSQNIVFILFYFRRKLIYDSFNDVYICDNAFIAVGQVKSCQDQKPEQIQVQKSANCENTGSKFQNRLQLLLNL